MSGRTDGHSYANASTADTDARVHRRHLLQELLQPLLPLLHRNSVRRRLTVNSGNGDGRYYPYPGADVMVTANDPPRRYVFDRWDGDWEFLQQSSLTDDDF